MTDIFGDEFSNNLTGTNDNEFIEGLGGNDTIDGALGFLDRLFGSEGDDTITDTDGVNGANGGEGDDTIDVTFVSNWRSASNQTRSDGKILGGFGSDVITVTMNHANFFINLKGDEVTSDIADGNDTVTLLGTYANSVVDLGGGNDTFNGGVGRDNISGQYGDDIIDGNDSNDRLNGGSGDDLIIGDAGADQLVGGLGFLDRMFGGDSNDRITDEDGVNGAHGGADDDTINVTFNEAWQNSSGLTRSDGKITGGAGNDTISVRMDNASFFINLKGDEPSGSVADGNDTITLRGTYGNAVVDLGGGNDVCDGGRGRDNVAGGDGNDLIDGNLGQDKLNGGMGDDTLIGGKGNDQLTGGSGLDAFQLVAGDGSDTIADFQDGQDLLELTGALTFDNLTISGSGTNTSITLTSSNELLATLSNIDFTSITEADFLFPV